MFRELLRNLVDLDSYNTCCMIAEVLIQKSTQTHYRIIQIIGDMQTPMGYNWDVLQSQITEQPMVSQ